MVPTRYSIGPVLMRKHVDIVDGQVVRVLYEPISNDQVVELADGDAFVTAMFPVDPFRP